MLHDLVILWPFLKKKLSENNCHILKHHMIAELRWIAKESLGLLNIVFIFMTVC